MDDGEIVFPMEAMGRQAKVEGVVEKLELSREQILSYRKHLAEEKGFPLILRKSPGRRISAGFVAPGPLSKSNQVVPCL